MSTQELQGHRSWFEVTSHPAEQWQAQRFQLKCSQVPQTTVFINQPYGATAPVKVIDGKDRPGDAEAMVEELQQLISLRIF